MYKRQRPGGMLVYGIPSFKLEKNVVDAEIEVMRELGVDIKCGEMCIRDRFADRMRQMAGFINMSWIWKD